MIFGGRDKVVVLYDNDEGDENVDDAMKRIGWGCE